MKIVYSDPKSGRSAQVELDKEKSALMLNYKIGDVIEGDLVGIHGCKLKITGGSDSSGFPMDRSIQGTIKTTVMKPVSESGRLKGIVRRKTVRGGMISQDVELVNTVIVEHGSRELDELFPKKEKKEKGEAAEKGGNEQK